MIDIDVISHQISGIQGPQDLEGLQLVLGKPRDIEAEGEKERWFFDFAIVDIDNATQSIELIDFTPRAPIKVFGSDPFREASVLERLLALSKDWELHSPGGYHYFYDLKVALYFDAEGDLSESTFGFFWANMPPRRKQV